jgi:hypothetical protein
MKPIIIYSNKFLDKAGIFFRIGGITLFPFVIVRHPSKKLINHETIHIQQQLELLVIPFYILYGLMYLFNYIKYRDINKAYYAIPFEKEAYANEEDYDYIQKRRLYSWIKYIK